MLCESGVCMFFCQLFFCVLPRSKTTRGLEVTFIFFLFCSWEEKSVTPSGEDFHSIVKSKFKPLKIIRSSVIKLCRNQDNIALGESKINALTTLNPTLSITDNLQSVQAWYLSKLPLWKMYYCNIASMLSQRYVNPSKEFIPTAILLTGTHLWKVLPAHASFRLILGHLNLIQSSWLSFL